MGNKRLLFLMVCIIHALLIHSQSIISLSGKVGERISIDAPSSNDSSYPELYSVQWSIFSGDYDCVSLVNATSPTVAVNILKEGNVRIKCNCYFFNSSHAGWGKKQQNTYYDITCIGNGGSGGGGGDSGGGGGGGNDDPTIPNPTVGAGWVKYGYYYYCAENTEEGVPMRFTMTNPDNRWCGTFVWRSGDAVCINPNTTGRVTIPAEVNGYTLYHVQDYSFCNCSKLTEVIIPNTAAYIEQAAFKNCTSLTTVTIPGSVKKVDRLAFMGCKSLKTVTCLGKTPPTTSIYSDPFDGAQGDMILYVPEGCKEVYESEGVWKAFKEIKEIKESFDITTSAAGYATFYSSESAYSLPNGLKACVVTQVANDKLAYSDLEGEIIPKGTAVMLCSADKKSGTYTLTRSDEQVSYTGANLLTGSDEATTTTGDGYHYKLSYGKSGGNYSKIFGWYWGAQNGGAFQIEGHKAWLVVPKSAGAPVYGFTAEGDATGIETVKMNDEDTVYYDLQGRSIAKPTVKGVYVNNGKKITVK